MKVKGLEEFKLFRLFNFLKVIVVRNSICQALLYISTGETLAAKVVIHIKNNNK